MPASFLVCFFIIIIIIFGLELWVAWHGRIITFSSWQNLSKTSYNLFFSPDDPKTRGDLPPWLEMPTVRMNEELSPYLSFCFSYILLSLTWNLVSDGLMQMWFDFFLCCWKEKFRTTFFNSDNSSFFIPSFSADVEKSANAVPTSHLNNECKAAEQRERVMTTTTRSASDLSCCVAQNNNNTKSVKTFVKWFANENKWKWHEFEKEKMRRKTKKTGHFNMYSTFSPIEKR